MALLSVIRRWRHRDKISIRQIAKRTGLSRNTVRKYLARGVVEPKYSRPKARLVQELERVLSSRFTVVVIEHTTKPFAAMNKIIG